MKRVALFIGVAVFFVGGICLLAGYSKEGPAE
jgi:hypothetical protein